jgi:hypothetical protein
VEEPLEELPGMSDRQPAATEAGATPAPVAAAAPGGKPGGAAGLDFLPDIGSMQNGEPAPRAAPPRRDRDRTRPSDAAHDVLARQDPAQLARGLRTILKRDERP